MLTSTSQVSIMPDEMIDDWLSISEAAQRSGYDKEYIRQLLRRGDRFEAVKKGSIWLIEPTSFDAYCQKMKELGTAKHDPTRVKGR
jgi:hypothetical protein